MRTGFAFVVVCGLAGSAAAGPKLLVLRAESTVDWATRTHVEDVVMGLARNVDRGVGQSETSFKQVADMIGCTKDFAACRTDVIETLAVDEVVVIDIAPAAGDQITVHVRRASKTTTKEATAVAGKDDDAVMVTRLGPLFGATKLIGGPAKKPGAPPKANVTSGAVVVDNEEPPMRGKAAPPPAKAEPVTPEPPPPAKIEPVSAAPVVHDGAANAHAPAGSPPTVADASATGEGALVTGEPVDHTGPQRSRAGIAMMIGGGALAVVGVVFWAKASGIEDEIGSAPNRTSADVDHLLDLEDRGDRYATLGNVALVGGLVVAGVGTYLFWRSGKHPSSTTARIAPLVVPGGGGLALEVR